MGNVRSVLIEQIEQISAPILQEHGAELVDLQYVHEHGQWILRFFLDKERGITLDDCAVISEHLGRVLDASDVIPQAYSLEVSSPGLNRSLRKESDYRRFLGERVDVTLYAPLNGRRHFRGILQAIDDGNIVVHDASEQDFSLPLSGIAKAKLDPDIQF